MASGKDRNEMDTFSIGTRQNEALRRHLRMKHGGRLFHHM